MRRSRYGRYHDGPDPLAPPVDLREALDAIGEDVLEGASPRRALQEMLRRGTKNMRGLDDLAAQAAKRRRDLLKKNNLDGTLQEVRELLDKAVLEERKALARALDDDARFQEMQIGDLSPSTAQAVQELSDYDWRSSEGRENYEKIKDLLGREMLDQRFAGMKQALEGATEEDRQAISDMLKDLNEMLDAHNKGEDTDEQFEKFMDKHGQHFPENPENVDELLDSLAQRAAAAQRLRNSLTPEQRAELDALAQQAFGDSNLLNQLDQLDQNLQQARPGEDWDGSQNFRGENGMGLGDGTGALQDIADLENLGNQLSQQYNGAALDDIDADALLKQLGPEAAADARMLAELEKALQQQGFMDKGADGQWRLSPKAMRQLGQSALKDVAGKLSRRGGERDTRKAGAMGEPTGASRAWEFGDTEPWDVTRTVNNAVLRSAATGSGFPVQLQVTDVEISETETRTQAAVALLVDTSFSMVMDGRWVPMKRTALALNHLVSTRFRGDDLQLIGFGRHAQTLTASELAGLDGAYDQGTNLHHALMLAVRHLRRHPNAQPVVLIVTDGEPTAHLEPDGHAFFDYPPSSKTLGLTVRELDTVAKLGAQVTIFRLGDDPGLARVVDKMAERVGGRVIAPDLDGLGAAVVTDYLKRRRS
ncbi:VWA domain-containing protein [Rhodococcus sp. IEGM 1401]|uniref:VWA domain-containing protein n=1 Tax=unclassified Rhodococcus (in: high G+C Gram-positive bacteria) TaxID=192944 RepID=UPI0022B34EC4|nr:MULTISPECIES: VWA domain-containing protein [unclassified Rhodococcus (in: high G+C Gram-positive bacteria)]MCZ4560964.1 VWA domain-containing protein [Rhodococcus sp. IEGM 1401]MDI9921130.1 VWA domain-containing protein [Rhodococcus sp. IEGM 1372]MDV8033583.1 VWA domain-containing protein [Rhodococcus sp. IEGM 1414]